MFIGLGHENLSLYVLILKEQTVAKLYWFSLPSAVDSYMAFLGLLTECGP